MILDVTSLLFAGHGELCFAFNHCLPPGYRMEATDDYVEVFVPSGGWRQYPNGHRYPHPAISSPN